MSSADSQFRFRRQDGMSTSDDSGSGASDDILFNEYLSPAMSSTRTGFQSFFFEDAQSIPNNPCLPLLWWQGLLPQDCGPEAFETLFACNGWIPAWRYGIFAYPHFHSISHEVLGIANGIVKVRLGGATGTEAQLRSGDVVLIPAGVGHQNLGANADLLVVGAYPPGCRADLMRDATNDAKARERIKKVPMPDNDPVDGSNGKLHQLWRTDDYA